MIYTGTVYRKEYYQKELDLHTLNITVKSGSPFGKKFAPTWDMVTKYYKDKNAIDYIEKYNIILNKNKNDLIELSEIVLDKDVVFICYCRHEAFCHRKYLANYLQNLSNDKIKYLGEIK